MSQSFVNTSLRWQSTSAVEMTLEDAQTLYRLQTNFETDPRNLRAAYDLFVVIKNVLTFRN